MVLDSSTIAKNRSVLERAGRRYEANRDLVLGDISEISGGRQASAWERLIQYPKGCLPLFLVQEAVLEWVQRKLNSAEIARAFEDFQKLTGRVFPDETVYNQRASYFLDCFTFEKKMRIGLEDQDESPFAGFMSAWVRTHVHQLGDEKLSELQKLAHFVHSLFKVTRCNRKFVQFEDLWTGRSYRKHIEKSVQSHTMFHKNLIYQGFIYDLAGGAHLSSGVFTHRSTVSRVIRRTVRKNYKEPEKVRREILYRLANLHLRNMRQRYICPAKIYHQALLE